jgi:hypothetical protein
MAVMTVYITEAQLQERKKGNVHIVWEDPADEFLPMQIDYSELENGSEDVSAYGEACWFLPAKGGK